MPTTPSSPLIDAQGLRAVLADVTVLDVRYRMGGPSGPEEYAAGHVPGAAYVDLDHDLADAPGERGRHPLPDPDRFGAAMRRAGVRTGRPVVVYDDWAGRAAARCWWLLRHHGHDGSEAWVRVLDGGWAAWADADLPIETGETEIPLGDFRPTAGRLRVLAADDVPTFDGVLVDAREPERFRGDVEPVDPVAGHIPGALNLPTSTNLGVDGRFRSRDELAAAYAPVVDSGEPVAVYCGSGVTATHDLLALAVQGVEGALYAGSWSEWVRDPGRPVTHESSDLSDMSDLSLSDHPPV